MVFIIAKMWKIQLIHRELDRTPFLVGNSNDRRSGQEPDHRRLGLVLTRRFLRVKTNSGQPGSWQEGLPWIARASDSVFLFDAGPGYRSDSGFLSSNGADHK